MTSNLIWIDLEMTGLDPERDVILEIAAVITDSDLNLITEGISIAIFQPDTKLDKMDAWNQKHHLQSGLLAEVRQSEIFIEEAEAVIYDFVSSQTEPKKSPLCGNSISQDRNFLKRYMPTLEAHFHYRNIDVSSVKELVRRWAPGVRAKMKKNNSHRALDDILESIAELNFYRQFFIAAEFQVDKAPN